MWTPLCAESKLINKSLLTIASITFFFNPTVDIAFIGEKLKPAIGKEGGRGHSLTVRISGRQIPHVYIYIYLIWPYLSTPSGQTYVITPLILIVKPKVVYSSNPKRAVFSTIKVKRKQVHEDSDYCNRSSWFLAKPWKKKRFSRCYRRWQSI